MGDAYARIIVNKMAKFITGKDDLIAKYLSEMGLAVKNAGSVADGGLKQAFTEILRGNSLL